MQIFTILLASAITSSWAFVPSSLPRVPVTIQKAGGFEWEDPTESFDQGVDNPFKNQELMNSEDGMKVDPARLLGPRLNGANLYFVGMMGSGKTAVGDIVARSKCFVACFRILHRSVVINNNSFMQEWAATIFLTPIKLLRKLPV
jgi:hypothetical protein